MKIDDNYIVDYFFLHNIGSGEEDVNRFERKKRMTPYRNAFELDKFTKKLDTDIFLYLKRRYDESLQLSLHEILWWIAKGLTERPVCPGCGGKLEFTGLSYGYKRVCSRKCHGLNQERLLRKHELNYHLPEITSIEQVNDDVIIDFFFNKELDKKKRSNLIQSYAAIYKDDRPITKSNLSNRYVYKYLLKRYEDFDSITEVIYRINNHVEERPVCEICGKRLKFKGGNKTEDSLFPNYCSPECKHKATIIHKVEAANKKEEARQARLIEYGKPIDDDVIKEMFLNGFDKKERLARLVVYTNLKRNQISETYPVYMDVLKYLNNRYKDSASIQETLYRIEHGIEDKPKCPICGKPVEYVGKPSITWRKYCSNECKYEDAVKNLLTCPTTNAVSNSELKILDDLKIAFPDAVSQYKSEEYPFNCDIYIPEIRLYIEYQGFYTHGGKPYEGTEEDNILLAKMLENKGGFVKENWTIRDPKKRVVAKKNNINIIELWRNDLGKKRFNLLLNSFIAMIGKSDDEIKEIIKKVSLHKTAYEIDYVPEESL